MVQNSSKIPCPICNERIYGKYFYQHLSVHFNYQPFECQHAGCGARFSSEMQIDVHFALRHNGVKETVVVSNRKTEIKFLGAVVNFVKFSSFTDGLVAFEQVFYKLKSSLECYERKVNGGAAVDNDDEESSADRTSETKIDSSATAYMRIFKLEYESESNFDATDFATLTQNSIQSMNSNELLNSDIKLSTVYNRLLNEIHDVKHETGSTFTTNDRKEENVNRRKSCRKVRKCLAYQEQGSTSLRRSGRISDRNLAKIDLECSRLLTNALYNPGSTPVNGFNTEIFNDVIQRAMQENEVQTYSAPNKSLPICDADFYDLQQHLPNEKIFLTKRWRRRTGQMNSARKLRVCPTCGVSVYHLAAHVKYSHGLKINCRLCHESVPTIYYRQHAIEKHSADADVSYVAHRRTRRRPLSACSTCGKFILNVKAHEQYAHGRRVKCSIGSCLKIVPELYMNRHVKDFHADFVEPQYI